MNLTHSILFSKVRKQNLYSYLILNLIIGEFKEEDFYYGDCEDINSIILAEAKTFVTFMQSMVEDMLG